MFSPSKKKVEVTSACHFDLSRCMHECMHGAWTHGQHPETDGGNDRDNDGSNALATPGADNEDGVGSLSAEVWMARAGGGMQRRFPAHATLAKRVRRGNDLVGERDIAPPRAHLHERT